ncbi:type II toxin-antitoxin system VapC family toxin [Pengzhenrongella sp.]|uniref:PIN domain-containing protein n=1 Tax=Pengzhenrongella sp. TaxID=2888820 RepID=UPI002F92CE60
MSLVLDASALLAFLRAEPGADVVEACLTQDPCCAAVNWSEVAQKVRATGADWPLARALLLSYGVRVEPSTLADAEWAAERWRHGEGLSLADRFCLALAARMDAPVWTADTAWGSVPPVHQIR